MELCMFSLFDNFFCVPLRLSAGTAGVLACKRPADADAPDNCSTSRIPVADTPEEPALQAGTPAVQSVGPIVSAWIRIAIGFSL